MAITLSTAARNAACAAVAALCNQGSGAGKLKLKAGATVLCTIALSDPAFGAPSVGVATASGLPLSAVVGTAGTVDGYDVTDSDDAVIWSGTMSGPALTVGQTAVITAWTHTAPAT